MMFADKIVTRDVGNIVYNDSLSAEYSNVLAFYKVSQKKFTESLNYYQSNPELQKSLYDSVYSYGTKIQTQLQEKIRKADSLKNLQKKTDTSAIQLKTDSLRKDSLRKDSIRIDSIRIDSLRKNSLIKDTSFIRATKQLTPIPRKKTTLRRGRLIVPIV